jgi:hypothetical protein
MALPTIKQTNEREKTMNEEQARYEFNNLRSDDDHFDAQWGYNDHEAQEKSFYEWCSLYDDLKHIKKTKEVN